MMKRATKLIGMTIAWALLGGASPSQATTIFYSVSPIGGSTFEYAYLVENDSLAVSLEEFTLFFDRALFENLQAVNVPAGWDPLVAQPDPLLAEDGFLDVLALGLADAIDPGGLLGGFSIRFDWLGSGSPGAQAFEIRDALTFDLLDVGVTVPIPEPGPALLMLLGLAVLARPWTGFGLRAKGQNTVRDPA
ncbi:MAG TPA: hypothetical protein ENI85_15225 [Deltaproteobacteria bacterium]|nr:hypothetical protein [Deltaproteobacteria bacterium]